VTADIDPLVKIQRGSYERAAAGVSSSWPERDALDANGLASLVKDVRYCVFATARPDGRAHAAPVAYTVTQGTFWIATVEGLRLRNLHASPWASLVAMDGEGDRRAPTLTRCGRSDTEAPLPGRPPSSSFIRGGCSRTGRRG
jgi:hypothetical protein